MPRSPPSSLRLLVRSAIRTSGHAVELSITASQLPPSPHPRPNACLAVVFAGVKRATSGTFSVLEADELARLALDVSNEYTAAHGHPGQVSLGALLVFGGEHAGTSYQCPTSRTCLCPSRIPPLAGLPMAEGGDARGAPQTDDAAAHGHARYFLLLCISFQTSIRPRHAPNPQRPLFIGQPFPLAPPSITTTPQRSPPSIPQPPNGP